ncbi:MAG: NAD-binding protein [Gemmatimonadetes bacterium]|nr:NAD-binding protein [Gemmatimonadota bacterium]
MPQTSVTACFGDVTSDEVLEYLGIDRAKELVVAVNDPDAALRAVRRARQLSSSVRIVARGTYVEDAVVLRRAGAADVVIAEVESAGAMADRILEGHGADAATVERQQAHMRARLGTLQDRAGPAK